MGRRRKLLQEEASLSFEVPCRNPFWTVPAHFVPLLIFAFGSFEELGWSPMFGKGCLGHPGQVWDVRVLPSLPSSFCPRGVWEHEWNWDLLQGVGVDGFGGIPCVFCFSALFLRFSLLFFFLLPFLPSSFAQQQTAAISQKKGELHSDPVCNSWRHRATSLELSEPPTTHAQLQRFSCTTSP